MTPASESPAVTGPRAVPGPPAGPVEPDRDLSGSPGLRAARRDGPDRARSRWNAADQAGPGFGATVASEWTKLFSLRSSRITVVLAVVVALAMTGLVSTVVGATWDSWDADGRAEFDPVLFPQVGAIFAGVLMAVLAVKVITAEYSSGMMRLTLTATPRRGRLLVAKAVVVTVVNLAVGTVVTVGVVLVGQVVFAAYGLPTASFTDADTLRALLGLSLVSPVFPLIGMVLGVLLRGTAAALTSVLGLIFAPVIFGPILPGWWQRNIVTALPGPATDSIAIAHLDDATDYPHPAVAVLVVAIWLAALLGAAHAALNRRDA